MIYDRRELLILGEALMAHSGLSPSDLGRAVAGHYKLFVRLRDGLDARPPMNAHQAVTVGDRLMR